MVEMSLLLIKQKRNFDRNFDRFITSLHFAFFRFSKAGKSFQKYLKQGKQLVSAGSVRNILQLRI